ncbi:branched-chain amino acid ABC transporter permease [Marinibaculum pumilum]|uniref:Branched-chain amino acid ABC transporter permease n=1 Tax=Marinibaculum pumilum TaxID=1766165 RepID=A0ABV7L513_9PROT
MSGKADSMAPTLPAAAPGASRRRRAMFLAIAAVIVLLATMPLAIGDRFLFTLIQMLVGALFALSFNLLWRHARLLSFGHAAYFGIGMFATIHLMRAVEGGAIALPAPLIPFAGALGGMLLGAAAGWFATVRTGTYFAMITLAIAELMYALGPQLEPLFGGEMGMSSMRMPWAGLSMGPIAQIYWLVLAWTLPAIASLYLFGLTPLGRVAFALGDDETRVRFLGYNARLTKTIVFVVSATYAGLAGGLLAFVTENVNYTIFSGTVSAAAVLHTFVGGSGLFLGPVFGAAGLTLLGALLADTTRLWLLYQGLIFVGVMLFVPQGLTPLVLSRWRRWRAPEGRRVLFRDAARTLLFVLLAALAVGGIEALNAALAELRRSS